MRQALSFSRKQEKDPLMDYLLSCKEKTAKTETLLTDGSLTALFLVTIPEKLPVAATARFLEWSSTSGIPVGGVIVNRVIGKEEIGEATAEFMRKKAAEQDERMAEIRSLFGDRVRAIAPLFGSEVKGERMLHEMNVYLFS